MSNPPALRIELALKGRSLKSFTFAKESITIGRDPDADVALDNMGVSRRHARIEWVNESYRLRDEGSSNGTFLNGRRVEHERLVDRDVVTIGKFNLLVALPALSGPAPRSAEQAAAPGSAEMDGTMVLSHDQLARVLRPAPEPPAERHVEPQPERHAERHPERQPALGIVNGAPVPRRRPALAAPLLPWIMAVVGALLIGLAVGAAIF